MILQNIVFGIYTSLIKRVYSIFIPLIIFLLYFSAFGGTNEIILNYFSRLGLSTLHAFSGFVLILALAVLMYDKIFRFVTMRFDDNEENLVKDSLVKQLKNGTYQGLVEVLFYFLLICIVLMGSLLFAMEYHNLDYHLSDLIFVRMVHSITGWLFLSVILVKYYLSITQWLEAFLKYLKEY